MNISTTRRKFMRNGVAGLIGISAYSLFHRDAFAAPELLDENSPQAQALGYKHVAAEVDTAKWAKRAGDEGSKQFCHNCNLYQGQGTEGVGGCPIFAGKQVKAGGRCNAWIAKAG